ncbi:MAG: phosphatase PAP2 family protein [Solirubrobacterales bacterium]
MASGVQTETTSGELALPALPHAPGLGRAPASIARPTPEGTGAAARGASATHARWWVETLVVVWLCWVYDAIANFAPLRLHAALAHGYGVLHLERTLGLDPELALNRWLTAHRTLGLVLSDYYDNAHFIVTLGLLGWLWYRRADIYRPLRNALVAINVLGFAVFLLYPTAPPRLLGGSGFSDVVASTGALGGWHTGALASTANQLAAMPSLHMAWAVWCSLVLWSLTETEGPDRSRETRASGANPRFGQPATGRLPHPLAPRLWVRVAAVLYPCMTCVAVLATGNHYLLDVFAGVATAALAVLLVRALESRRRPRGACHKVVTKSQNL